MEKLFLQLIAASGPLGAIVAAALLIFLVGVWLRQRGMVSLGDRTRIVSRDEFSKIDHSLSGIGRRLEKVEGEIEEGFGTMERRLSAVEHDLEGRPTREEVHQLELAIARTQGAIDGIERTVTATNAAVTRIEDYMINYSQRAARKAK